MCRFSGRYKKDPQIKAMTDLVDAYQRREVHSAEKILKGPFCVHVPEIDRSADFRVGLDNRSTIMDDTFIRSYIGDLLRSLRTYYLIDLIKPYTRLELSFLAKVSASSVPTLSVLSVRIATERRDPRSRRPLDRADPGRESRWPNRPGRDEAGTRSEVSAYLCFILLILTRFNQTKPREETIRRLREMDRSTRVCAWCDSWQDRRREGRGWRPFRHGDAFGSVWIFEGD